jgi:hypothetical protein
MYVYGGHIYIYGGYIYIHIYGGHKYIYIWWTHTYIYIYMVDIYIFMVDTHTHIYIYVHHKSVCQPSGTSSSGFQRNISYIHLVHRVPTACDKPHTNAYTSTILRVVFSIPSIFKITIQYNSDKRCKQNII